ncbi:hypothetical protein LJ737_12695 [Hymenobacter sp. 15J16-1T3B]|uniref:hypothetical protein n=1 Tax=Hymenobacter sp. 15J16-1T3B TaxID=2886941 RepID=UPI001D123CE9|nr:hypothetical protein [Hymenobacter sp. 15J16-1T3B]MCC3158099.1 hypothetical protein [Hymenobacter sp. 15J16-1T3B]
MSTPLLARLLGRPGLLTALALALSTCCQAQVGLLIGAATAAFDDKFYRAGPGSYQLNGAPWQPHAELRVSNSGMVVGKGKATQRYWLDKFSQVVISADSFAVVGNARMGKALKPVDGPLLGQRVWRQPQVELFDFRALGGPLPLLRFPDQTALVLPRRCRDYCDVMLLLVGDHPALAEQLRQGAFDASHTRQILSTYLAWKPAGFDTKALSAAAPAAK